jgi:osmotically-inducible protein OsmY
MHKPNNLLERDVREQLDWDPILDDTRIMVKADEGRIILSGAVYTYAEVGLAAEDAWDVAGVKTVDNELLVGLNGAAIADFDIAANCTTALDGDKFVPKGAVSATVVDGWVTLSGEVRRHYQRKAAEHAVGRVAGVLGVTDLLSLSDEPIPADVADRINRAFDRNAIIDGSLIEVSNVGHTVYLDGTTPTWRAMSEAVDTTWSAPGVTEVVNRLVVAA